MNADDTPQPADPSPPQDAPAADAPPPGPTPLARLLPAAIAGVVLALCLGLLLGRWSAPAPSPQAPPAPEAAPTVWTCSMHPQIRAAEPGACPVCGMDLIPLTSAGDDLGPRELRLSPAAAALAEVETTPVQRQRVSRELRLVGKVDFDESRFDYITAWVPGRLDRHYVDTTGTLVREGDHLVELFSPAAPLGAGGALQALEAQRLGRGRVAASSSPAPPRAPWSRPREKLRLWGLGRDQIAEVERTGRTSTTSRSAPRRRGRDPQEQEPSGLRADRRARLHDRRPGARCGSCSRPTSRTWPSCASARPCASRPRPTPARPSPGAWCSLIPCSAGARARSRSA
ncbi:MAG: efflux RND transporter periplasmic adaptor subunit [Planctomycetota bacterium]